MLTWWQAIVLGLVEGITEYLPVSSTGHLILVSSLLHLNRPETKDGLDTYLVVVQGGAIAAVVLLYRERVAQMVRGLLGRDADGFRLACNIALAFVPAAIAGAVLGKTIKGALFSALPVLMALFAGGVFMIWLGRRGDRGRDELAALSWRTALGVGLFQTLALWPGTSRSMVTIGGGMLLGLRAPAAAEFSFLLGLPTLGAACLHDLVGDLRHAAATGSPSMFQELGVGPIVLGIVVATVAAMLAVRWLVSFLNERGLAPFGWYRIALSLVLGALVVSGAVAVR